MPMIKPEHRPGTEIYRRKRVERSHLRITVGDSWVGEGYRLSHSRMRIPTTGDDVWVPNYSWDLPADGLSREEVEERIECYNAEAKKRYEREKEEMEERRRRTEERWADYGESHPEVRSESVGGVTRSWIPDEVERLGHGP